MSRSWRMVRESADRSHEPAHADGRVGIHTRRIEQAGIHKAGRGLKDLFTIHIEIKDRDRTIAHLDQIDSQLSPGYRTGGITQNIGFKHTA